MREIDITEKCLEFIDNQGERVSDKFFQLIEIIGEVKIVHTNFVKKLKNSRFYERIMKTIKAKNLLEERYGKKGSKSREKFREEAYSYYFGEIIKNRRKKLKMSQEKLAEAVGKKRPYISRIENGEDVRISNLLLVANALDLSIQLTEK
jgi:ribosome-binding protein aMBF1 (putative translation factor)